CGDCPRLVGYGMLGDTRDSRCAPGLQPYNVNPADAQPLTVPTQFSCWLPGSECTPPQTLVTNGYAVQRRRAYIPPSGSCIESGCGDCPIEITVAAVLRADWVTWWPGGRCQDAVVQINARRGSTPLGGAYVSGGGANCVTGAPDGAGNSWCLLSNV